jgi:predicted AlkP superfamily phosphohydrolase/phosphomutase
MPHLGELQKTSMWGVLKSTVPAVTPPAWAALSTGKHPGKTGVYAFYVPTDSIDHFRHMTSLDVHSETLPEMLEKAGLAVHVINLPTFSYPAKIEGTVLGDVLTPPGRRCIRSLYFKRKSFGNTEASLTCHRGTTLDTTSVT